MKEIASTINTINTMKQITRAQAEALATSDEYKLDFETKFYQSQWIKENSMVIADIECKRCPRDYYGTWPKGWKAQMRKEAKEKARKYLIDRFMRDKCFELDGAIWLNDWQLVTELANK